MVKNKERFKEDLFNCKPEKFQTFGVVALDWAKVNALIDQTEELEVSLAKAFGKVSEKYPLTPTQIEVVLDKFVAGVLIERKPIAITGREAYYNDSEVDRMRRFTDELFSNGIRISGGSCRPARSFLD